MRKGEAVELWSVPNTEKAISCVTLSKYKPGKKQNIFCSSGNIIRGFSGKGKNRLNYQNNLGKAFFKM